MSLTFYETHLEREQVLTVILVLLVSSCLLLVLLSFLSYLSLTFYETHLEREQVGPEVLAQMAPHVRRARGGVQHALVLELDLGV